MSQFVITGGQTLAGSIPVFGAKNAALPLLAASLLTSEKVTLTNIPKISDVATLLSILERLGVKTAHDEAGVVTIEAGALTAESLAETAVSQLRGSILLLGPLLARFQEAHLPEPGGDIIGARPIDAHLDAFEQFGARCRREDGMVHIDAHNLSAQTVVLKEFSVTATENALLLAATLPGTSTIHIAAAEPHVVALAQLLERMGAKITGAGTHTIIVEGNPALTGATFENIPDMIEAGYFILLAAATRSELTIEGVPIEDLRLFFKKLDEIGIRCSVAGSSVTVHPSDLRGFRLQTLPHPGIPTDLQAPFGVLATQASGSSLIHDPLYEGRFRYATELSKMGARITMCDPHRIIVEGPTPLSGRHIPSLDIRAGATLVTAGLLADGQTVIDEAEIIDRGFASLLERLQAVGAHIERQ